MAIKISACVIVKNEAKNMPRWLECMKNVADEIIVVDTGSTDNTVELARNSGAQLYYFEWIKDFAAAKNYAIEQATGDWILFLDADETFTPAAQKVLRQEMERFHRDKSVACLLCRLLDIDTDDGDRLFNTSLLPRIFRCSPHIRYVGAIHEQLENSQGNKRMVFAQKLEILHTGYSSSIVRSKTERNLPILLQELENANTDKERRRLYPYLMDAYNTFGDYDKVLYYGQKCIDNGYSMIGDPEHFYETITMSMFNVGKPLSEVLDKLDEAEEKFPEEPFFSFLRGMVLQKKGDDCGAERAILKGLELRKPLEEEMERGVGASDTSRGFLPYAYKRLGDIYSRRGESKRAAENYYISLKHHKYMSDSLRGLYDTLSDADDIDIIELLNTIYNREKDGSFILRSLKGYGSAKVMAYYGNNVNG
ncbi:MAG: glycosyltransferase family 2 protein, partial [Anaerovibrio sp.]|nr:glycosyltransferase family 2 protein [Anaerovibrio sp.]